MKKAFPGSKNEVSVPLALIKMIQEKLDSSFISPWEKKELKSSLELILCDGQEKPNSYFQYLKKFDYLMGKTLELSSFRVSGELDNPHSSYFLEGFRFGIAKRFLELVEEEEGEFLWLTQSSPFDYGFNHGLRVAQAQYGAPVLSKYLPKDIYLAHLGNLCKNKLVIAEIPEESSQQSFLFFLWVLEAAADSNYQTIFIHLDEGLASADETAIDKACEGLKKLRMKGKKIYFGCDRFIAGSPQEKLASALKGVLQ